MKRTLLPLFLLIFVNNNINTQTNKRTLLPTGIKYEEIKEENGFVWSKVTDHSKELFHNIGVSIGGKTIIPTEYYRIEYLYAAQINKGYFVVEKKENNSYKKGLFDVNGLLLIPIKFYSVDILNKPELDDVFFIVEEDYHHDSHGIYSTAGQLIVPYKYETIEHIQADSKDKGYFFAHNYTPDEGACYSLNGKELIKHSDGIWKIESKRYTDGSIRLQVNKKEGGNYTTGFAREDGTWIIPPHRSTNEYTDDKGIYYTYLTDDLNHYFDLVDYEGNILIHNSVYIPKRIITTDGLVFYIIGKQSEKVYYGLLNEARKEVVPCEYEQLKYIGGKYIAFKTNGVWGVFDTNIKVIIPTSRGYTSIGNYNSLEKVIPFTKPGYKGQCDSNGKQISLIKTEDQVNNNTSNSKESTPTKAASQTNGNTSNTSVVITPVQQYTPTTSTSSPGISSSGNPRQIEYYMEDCYMCHGSGKCSTCNGTHRINYMFGSGDLECPNCGTDGRCKTCNGTGKVQKMRVN